MQLLFVMWERTHMAAHIRSAVGALAIDSYATQSVDGK